MPEVGVQTPQTMAPRSRWTQTEIHGILEQVERVGPDHAAFHLMPTIYQKKRSAGATARRRAKKTAERQSVTADSVTAGSRSLATQSLPSHSLPNQLLLTSTQYSNTGPPQPGEDPGSDSANSYNSFPDAASQDSRCMVNLPSYILNLCSFTEFVPDSTEHHCTGASMGPSLNTRS